MKEVVLELLKYRAGDNISTAILPKLTHHQRNLSKFTDLCERLTKSLGHIYHHEDTQNHWKNYSTQKNLRGGVTYFSISLEIEEHENNNSYHLFDGNHDEMPWDFTGYGFENEDNFRPFVTRHNVDIHKIIAYGTVDLKFIVHGKNYRYFYRTSSNPSIIYTGMDKQGGFTVDITFQYAAKILNFQASINSHYTLPDRVIQQEDDIHNILQTLQAVFCRNDISLILPRKSKRLKTR